MLVFVNQGRGVCPLRLLHKDSADEEEPVERFSQGKQFDAAQKPEQNGLPEHANPDAICVDEASTGRSCWDATETHRGSCEQVSRLQR